MIEQEYSITRTRSTWKPRVTSADIPFFEAEDGSVLLGVSGDSPAAYSGTGRTLVAEMPYASIPEAPAGPLARTGFISAEDLPDGIAIDYRFDGGFNNNVLVFTWKIADEGRYRMEWACLKTFTGMQMKYVLPNKRPPLTFAFADEDAFAYCDKKPCEECAFRCKSGFALYAKIAGLGIARMSCERISSLKLEK